MSTIPGAVPEGVGSGRITLDQLIALNDEIAALVRAGVPLERGLLGVGDDLSGRLGEMTRALGRRLDGGESLPQALAAEGGRFPAVYRAVVEAGLRAGRLPAALEGLARLARGYAELRRALGLALMYPLMVLGLAYGLFLMFVLLVAPRFLAAFEMLRFPARGSIALLAALGETAIYWGPVVPALLLLFGLWWLRSGAAAFLEPGWASGPVRRVPWMRSVLASTEAANFADMLALLVEHRVPFPEAIGLAAEASGSPAIRAAAREIAEASRRGDSPNNGLRAAVGLPPMLRWLMATGLQQGTLVSALRHAAQTYRRRALNQAELIRIFLPTMLLFAIGATATLVFALTLFVPLATMFRSLAAP